MLLWTDRGLYVSRNFKSDSRQWQSAELSSKPNIKKIQKSNHFTFIILFNTTPQSYKDPKN